MNVCTTLCTVLNMKDAADPAANHAARLVLRASPSASPSRGPLSEVSKKHDFKYTRNDIITTAEPFPLSHVPRRRAWERLPRQLNTPGKCTRKIWKRYIPRVSAQPLAREQEGEFGSPGSKAIKNLCSAEAAGRPGFTKKRLGIAAQWKRRRSGLPRMCCQSNQAASTLTPSKTNISVRREHGRVCRQLKESESHTMTAARSEGTEGDLSRLQTR